jgi:hypothetical protein
MLRRLEIETIHFYFIFVSLNKTENIVSYYIRLKNASFDRVESAPKSVYEETNDLNIFEINIRFIDCHSITNTASLTQYDVRT